MGFKKANYNHEGGALWADIKMEGLVLVFYTFRYWSSKAPSRKVLIKEEDNNEQSHDDFFMLVDPDVPFEPMTEHSGRRAHYSLTILGTSDNESPYALTMSVYQGKDWATAKKNKLDEIVVEDKIKFENGKAQLKEMVIELI